ncbi:hypothetical protein IFU30_12425 [Plantibacter sp. CFBP 8798]|uniref:hypothetical protein n=1 Tax=Plantibacter sp. CFBP 8798 TaxID=2775268 RepID=UPI00178756BE|nr:hypothetical protein [Plantibacter sp. CFBP 8798]MBD8467075.1 hypothetical protein [Plantibacter sp. CFBP 8798]
MSKENDVPLAQAELWFDEMLRWLSLVDRRSPESLFGPIAPSPSADEAWHAFILFTQVYTDYCNQNFAQYIHHIPTMPGDEGDHSAYYRSRRRLLHEFGDLDPTVWPYLVDRPAQSESWQGVGHARYHESVSISDGSSLFEQSGIGASQLAESIVTRRDVQEFATEVCSLFLLPAGAGVVEGADLASAIESLAVDEVLVLIHFPASESLGDIVVCKNHDESLVASIALSGESWLLGVTCKALKL